MKETTAVKATGVDSRMSGRGIVSVAAAAKRKKVLRFMVRRISSWPQKGETIGTWVPEATEALVFTVGPRAASPW
jgi:hypothetical protein